MEKCFELDEIINHNPCLNCKNPSCVKGCPINQPIPDFIRLAKEHEYLEAYKIISKNSTLPVLCGILCPHEKQCEGHCIKGIKNNPVEIGFIETTIANIFKNEIIKIDNQLENINIVIIGGGIAGLSATIEALKHNAKITIYEKTSSLGGAVKKNIPSFRFDDYIIDDITNNLLNLGVKIKYNYSFGDNLSIDDLKEFDFIIFAMGTMNERTSFDLNKPHLYQGNKILEDYKKTSFLPNGHKCIVIGAGNTAMDVSRVFAKNNYDTTIVYRRTLAMSPALKSEIKSAKNDGVKFLELMAPEELIYENNQLKGLKVSKMKLLDQCDDSGRKMFQKTSESLILETDLVVEAIGSYPDYESLKKLNLPIFENNWLKLNENKNYSSYNNYYFIGDFVNGPTTVVNAMKSGLKSIDDIIKIVKE